MNRIWITWETQRRSIELAKHLNCKLFIFEEEGYLRYPRAILKTIQALRSSKPAIVFVQNPSMILALLACLYKIITRTPVVVDRHTTFLLDKEYKNSFRIIIFKILHHLTIRWADLTIITNEYLAMIVSKMHGRSFVLPDPLPDISSSKKINLKGIKNILMISSFGSDEPITEILAAMETLNENIVLYITGNYKKLDSKIVDTVPNNVVFTGFLDDQDFINMIYSVDAIMVLTTAESCMLCGCYEAVAAGQPLITSNMKALREYFTGAYFVDNNCNAISRGIQNILDNLDQYRSNALELKNTLLKNWEKKFKNLEERINILEGTTDHLNPE